MVRGFFLATAVLALCLPMMARSQQENTASSAHASLVGAEPSQIQAQEPWRITPNHQVDTNSAQTPHGQLQSDGLPLNADSDKGIVLVPGGELDADKTCYAIRSYVVARDDKDSDSTHPVSYSTCVPASRYRLRTASPQSDSSKR